MKFILASLLASSLLVGPAFGADAFPEGSYSGTGTKQFDDGRRVTYRVEMVLKKSDIAFTYHFGSAAPVKFALAMTFGKQGYFQVGSLGSGYCAETSCHWTVRLGKDHTEQWTLVFSNGGKDLFKTGSLVGPKGSNWWEERLTRLDTGRH